MITVYNYLTQKNEIFDNCCYTFIKLLVNKSNAAPALNEIKIFLTQFIQIVIIILKLKK